VCNTWKYFELDGFTITNGSTGTPAVFDYILSTTGPAFFAEMEGNEPFEGTTPLLSPGESHWVPGAGFYVNGDEVLQSGIAEQIVYYLVWCRDFPAFKDTSQVTIEFLPQTVAVLINDFEVVPLEGAVKIAWDVSSDDVIEGFNIYRTCDGVERLLNDSGLLSAESREYTDANVKGGTEYIYTLGVVTSGGTEMKSLTQSVEAKAIPLALKQNYPNPFNPVTTISFTLPEKAHVNIAVYNVEGKLMRVLVDETLDSGLKEIPWDGRDARGVEVSSGVYFYRLRTGKSVMTRKMVLLR
jgi:hypothetical protein